MSDDYDFMSTINEFLGKVSDRLMDGGMRGNYCRQLIHVTLYTPYIPLEVNLRDPGIARTGLGVEVVADHAASC